ncbi:MAG: DUF4837 family protein [Ignavibacteriaceae bacterium]|nr:DUF4837 family protein [Ignavibacteriaceae bacterium]
MKKSLQFLLSVIFLLSLESCEHSYKLAQGAEDEIIVVADTSDFEKLKIPLQEIFEKVIYTPQPEKLFNLKRISPNEIESYQNYKNVILLAPLNSSSNTSKFIKALLDTSKFLNKNSGNDLMIPRYNLWAQNQLVMILTAPDLPQLELELVKNKEILVNSFHKLSDKRLNACMYDSKYESKNTEGMLLKSYGWIIFVASDFTIADNEPDENFFCLKNSSGKDMGKWIFVHWIDNASPAYLNEDSVRSIRNRLTNEYYKTPGVSSFIRIGKDNCLNNEVTFDGKYSLLTQGLWENDKEMQGPFINYTFFDEKTKRIYMVDGSINAPEYYKRNLIQQMDVMLKSFKTKADLSKEKQDELLKSAD